MRKLLIASGVLLLAVVSGFVYARVRLRPLLRERVVTALAEHYRGEVDLRELDIRPYPFAAVGRGLVLAQRDRPGLPPLIGVDGFTIDASLGGMLSTPLRIRRVDLVGLRVNVPPKRGDRQKEEGREPKSELPAFVIDVVKADRTVLQILSKKEGKEPLVFEIARLTLNSAGIGQPMKFVTTLTNPRPPGLIESTGEFGPWQNQEPSQTPVAGNYTFSNANLAHFRGIAGMLASGGKYRGRLDEIVVDGSVDVPDFTVRISGHPVHLTADFHAIVDGTDGDTRLEPVVARFGRSTIVARGGVVGTPGVKGKTVALNVTVSDSRIEDLLRLAVKASKPPLTGAIAFRTQLEIPPGDVEIIDKLYLNGEFGLGAARFTSSNLQRRIEELSSLARGDRDEEVESVISNLGGRFVLRRGVIAFSNLTFAVPGAAVSLRGSYALRSEVLDFVGTVRTEAKVSQMTTGVKSFFLKLADPLFRKQGAGAVIPIKITGTREQPKFGLDAGRIF